MSSTYARPLLTTTEQSLLGDLVETLEKNKFPFCCGGTIEVPPEQKLWLFYKWGLQKQTHSIDLSDIDPAEIESLLSVSAPAPHGRGRETVYDESYRLARELCQGDFALSMELIEHSGILESVENLIVPVLKKAPSKLRAYLYKLNSYSTGGFFKAHQDTPKSSLHIGSLVVALPVQFTGGELLVSHDGKDVVFEWGTSMSSGTTGNIKLPWAFLFSDVKHEVLPVTSGTRVTLAYDIFVSETRAFPTPLIQAKTVPFYPGLSAILKNPDFLKMGGKVAFALSHAYPVGGDKSTFFASHLKGSDAALYSALASLNIPVEVRAVFKPEEFEDGDPSIVEFVPPDGFGPVIREYGGYMPGSQYWAKFLYTSKAYTTLELVDYEWTEGQRQLIEARAGARVEPEVICMHGARKPSGDVFLPTGSYIAYGNQAEIRTVYSSVALVFDIPPVGEGARAAL